jgi:hypothetical protein
MGMKKRFLPAIFFTASLPFLIDLKAQEIDQSVNKISKSFDNSANQINSVLPTFKPKKLPNEKFWIDMETGITIRSWGCPETQICLTVYGVDTDNKKMPHLMEYILGDKKVLPSSKITPEHMRRLCGFGTENGTDGGLKFFNMKRDEKGVISGQTHVALDIPRGKGKNYGFFIFNMKFNDLGNELHVLAWPNAGGGPLSFLSRKTIGKERVLNQINAPTTPACEAPHLTPIY